MVEPLSFAAFSARRTRFIAQSDDGATTSSTRSQNGYSKREYLSFYPLIRDRVPSGVSVPLRPRHRRSVCSMESLSFWKDIIFALLGWSRLGAPVGLFEPSSSA